MPLDDSTQSMSCSSKYDCYERASFGAVGDNGTSKSISPQRIGASHSLLSLHLVPVVTEVADAFE